MVYIYKKIIGKRPYYYLRASERKGAKTIVKDIAYLGSSIEEVKRALDNLPKHKEKIRKAYKTIRNFIESNHYLEKIEAMKIKKDEFLSDKIKEVEACRLHYKSVFSRNDAITKKEAFKNFIVEFAFNTTSIEGNTITLHEARNLLQEGRTPKDRTLREIYDLQNTERVFFDIMDSNKEITHEFIVDIHSKLMENIDARKGYRTTDVRVFKANFESTPAPYVKTDMGLLLKWYEKNKKILHPLVLAVIFHHKFEKIHPFMDGNGRTGRMLMNLILVRRNYPPIILHKKFSSEYLAVLREADKEDLTKSTTKAYYALVQFVADEMTNYYWGIFL